MKEIISTCIYCGCGCKLKYIVDNNKIIRTLPYPQDDISEGLPCIKGLTIHEVVEKNRVKKPLIRESKKKNFEEVDWNYIIEYLKDLFGKFEGSTDKVFGYASAEITLEDNYVFQKFFRIYFKSNNFDCCARLCHAPTVKAYRDIFGIGVSTDYVREYYDLDCLILVGTHPSETYPVIWNKIRKKIAKKEIKIIYINHFDSPSLIADIKVIVNPGEELIVLLAILKKLIEKHGLKSSYENFEKFKEVIGKINEKELREILGNNYEKIDEICEILLNSKRIGVAHGMGITQQKFGTLTVKILLSLALLLDAEILTSRGKINVQGTGEVLFFPRNPEIAKKYLEKVYGTGIPDKPGKTAIDAFILDPCDLYIILPSNPLNSLANLRIVEENLNKAIVIYFGTHFCKTCEFSNIVLPTPLLIEREGTIINCEGRIRKVNKVRENKDAKEFWEIAKKILNGSNYEKYFNYSSTKEIFFEICKVLPQFKVVNPEEVWSGKDNYIDKQPKYIRYPEISEEYVNSAIKFAKEIKNRIKLTTIRSFFLFCSGEITRSSVTLSRAERENLLFISEELAKEKNIKDKDLVEIIGENDEKITLKAKVVKFLPKNVIATRFHFEDGINKLLGNMFDEETKTPAYKQIIIKEIRKIQK